ncbi:MAG: S-layer homology domain-containing protein, partial [Clostridia bacterium]|nr:S-layer homology domain-containing protein [Clostridia bacterium]
AASEEIVNTDNSDIVEETVDATITIDEDLESVSNDNTDIQDEDEKIYFYDIDYNWAKNEILSLAEAKVISGKEEGLFEPESDITKAEFASMVVKAMNILIIENSNQLFEDVPSWEWYSKYANTLVLKGIVRRTANFEPNSKIKLSDAVCMLYSLATDSPSKNAFGYESTYKWFANMTEYQKDAFSYSLDNKLINKLFEYAEFNSDREITRAEAASLIYKFRTFYGI